jgi:hypothetical protein
VIPLLVPPLAACGHSGSDKSGTTTGTKPKPAIVIASPHAGASVRSPLRVRGTANTFEANFTIELRTGGGVIARKFVTATSGSGIRGTYDVKIPFHVSEETPGTLVAFEPSAKDGTPLHTVKVQLGLLPAG